MHSEVLSKKVSLDSFLADVYERLTKKGEKPGFMQLLAAQVTSAVWHVCSFPCPQISHLLQLEEKNQFILSLKQNAGDLGGTGLVSWVHSVLCQYSLHDYWCKR